ncbi:MAG: TolC family protein [Bacteroidales bacterium]|jgi:outer membrane protein TolC|nr:TolC family protein [Bacteroidales bacterium]
MKTALLLFITAFMLTSASAQSDTLSLADCLSKAEASHPLFQQYDLLASTSDLKVKNLGKNFLPDINISGDAHYQSDVTEIPFSSPAFPIEALDKDQYKISLDVSQMIYDGGMTRKNKDIEYIEAQINRANVGITLYQLKERIVGTYFSIISLQENRKILAINRENLKARLKDVESGIRNGVILASNAEILKAELLKIDQKEIEINAGIDLGYKILSVFTGEEISTGTFLNWDNPVVEVNISGNNRLEYSLFGLQAEKTDALKKLASSKLVPRFFAYGSAGYGKPGFNMLLNEFDDFYIIGAKLSWNVWNWNRTNNEKRVFDLQKQVIESNRDAFTRNLSADMEKRISEIAKYEALLPKDREIAGLRAGIVETYASQLQNGVITATDYMTEMNAETEAKLNLRFHEIQLVRAKYEYLAAAGKL